MATIQFTIPDEYADEMRRESGKFYLDVFGWVSDRETTEVIGRWERL